MRLDPVDILELGFNDRIWIKDTWYFVQKISDYVIGQTVLAKVELVKVPAIAIPGPIPLGATGATGGTTCRTVSICNNNTASPTGEGTYTYVDCDNNIASVTIIDSSCAAPICMLFPLINALPSGFTASDNGSCGSTGASLVIEMISLIDSIIIENPITTVEVQGSSGGTAGTYTTIQNYTFDGQQEFTVALGDIPVGFGLRVSLSSSYAPGTALVGQQVTVTTNGVDTTEVRSGTYQPISATFPAVVSASNTYTAYVNITY
jgi:hypothetical protein